MPLKVVAGRHGSTNLYLRGTVRGLRVDESTGTSDPQAAEEIRIKREGELLQRSIHGRSATKTFAEAALSYMQTGGERRFIEPLLKHFGRTRLAAIGQDEVDAAARKLFPKATDATRHRQVYTPMSAILRHAAKRKWCEVIKLERPTVPPGRVRFITLAEAEALIEACPIHLRRIVVFLLYTGARVSEAITLDWRHVDLDRRHVDFIKTKNGTARGMPLHPRVVAELRGINNRDGAVFRRPDGQPYEVKEDSGGQFKTAWRTACQKAGLVDFRPHDLRHTWATWFYRRKPDLVKLQKLGGWKTAAMVLRYAHTDSSTDRDDIDALPWGISGEAIMDDEESARKTA